MARDSTDAESLVISEMIGETESGLFSLGHRKEVQAKLLCISDSLVLVCQGLFLFGVSRVGGLLGLFQQPFHFMQYHFHV